ncbi:hypothetical protein ACVWXD_002761 [Pseudomonas sp. TE3911]
MGLEGVGEAARRNKGMQFMALLHRITPKLLAQSFYALRRDPSAGWYERVKSREAVQKSILEEGLDLN